MTQRHWTKNAGKASEVLTCPPSLLLGQTLAASPLFHGDATSPSPATLDGKSGKECRWIGLLTSPPGASLSRSSSRTSLSLPCKATTRAATALSQGSVRCPNPSAKTGHPGRQATTLPPYAPLPFQTTMLIRPLLGSSPVTKALFVLLWLPAGVDADGVGLRLYLERAAADTGFLWDETCYVEGVAGTEFALYITGHKFKLIWKPSPIILSKVKIFFESVDLDGCPKKIFLLGKKILET